MCGIAGYIGASKNHKLTYELITNLFDYLELRGTDAAGVWGTEIAPKGRVIYHKEPIRSSEFIKKKFWTNRIRRTKLDMMLVHARATSKGNGHASDNSNNHPFVSSDKRIGMVHNGTIDEANYLKNKYKIISNTDSEVLLRMYEHAAEGDQIELSDDIPTHVSDRLHGVRDIWSTILHGAMAVAFGERIDDHTRMLCLFHNEQRPLWMADLRESLGQLFFFSSPDIWYRALDVSSKTLQNICSQELKLHEVPVREAWFFMIDEKRPHFEDLSQMYPMKMKVKNTSRPWQEDCVLDIKGPEVELSVITELQDDKPRSLIVHPKNRQAGTSGARWRQDWRDGQQDQYEEPYAHGYEGGGVEHEQVCHEIRGTMDSISTAMTNACLEGSMSPVDYQEFLENLEQLRLDTEGLLRLVEG